MLNQIKGGNALAAKTSVLELKLSAVASPSIIGKCAQHWINESESQNRQKKCHHHRIFVVAAIILVVS